MRINGHVSIRIGKDRQPMLGVLVSVDLPRRTGIVNVRGVAFSRCLKEIYNKKLAIQHQIDKLKKGNR